MMKNSILRALLCQAVEWLLVVETVSESYTRTYEGYVFTFPGFSASVKRDAAQTWCTQNGSKLLEINSSNLQALTVRFLRDTGAQFVDATLLFTNGLRIDGSWNWVNGQDINSVTVAGQGPNLAYSFGYTYLTGSGPNITASIPTEMRSYICQGKFDCTNGFRINEQCYKSYSSGAKMTWFDARNQCLNEGGDLASFDFINDNQALKILNGSWLSSSTTYWIGIRKQWWTWETSNLEVIYSNWGNGRPLYLENARCLCLYKSGADWTWIECDCNLYYPFVCLTGQSTTLSPSNVKTTIANAPTSYGITRTAPTYSNTSTMEKPPLPTALTLCSTGDNDRALAVGLGIGIPLVLVILALSVVIALMKKKLSYQTRLLAIKTLDVDTVTHAQSPVKRNPQMVVNGSLEMVTEQSASPYESLKQEGTALSDGHYQELLSSGRREANGPETIDHEPVRG